MLQPHLPIILKSGRFFKRSTTTPDDKKIGINVNQRRKRMDFPYSFTPLSPSFVFLPFFFLFFFLPFLFSPVYQAPPTRSTIFLAKYGHRVESESLTEQSLLNAIIIIIISIKNNSREFYPFHGSNVFESLHSSRFFFTLFPDPKIKIDGDNRTIDKFHGVGWTIARRHAARNRGSNERRINRFVNRSRLRVCVMPAN